MTLEDEPPRPEDVQCATGEDKKTITNSSRKKSFCLFYCPWSSPGKNIGACCLFLLQSIIKEINPEYSLERLLLKLELQYFGYLM